MATDKRRRLVVPALAAGGVVLVVGLWTLGGIARNSSADVGRGYEPGAEPGARIGTIDSSRAEITRRRYDLPGGAEVAFASRRTSASATATSAPVAADAEPGLIQQQAYLDAHMAMMEEDGRDNALLHYALAFELAPEMTNDQRNLVNKVLEEGWSEEADELLPYLAQWETAFEEVLKGATLDYAKGIGTDAGWETPGPDFLKAQDTARMLDVYSHYLESQGRVEEARAAVDALLSMGQDFQSSDNLLIVDMIGTSMRSRGLTRMTALAKSGGYAGKERETILRLQELEQGVSFQSVLGTDMEKSYAGLRKALDDPDYFNHLQEVNPGMYTLEKLEQMASEHERLAALQSEHFSKPYYARSKPDWDEDEQALIGNYVEIEVRRLSVTSRMRQLQIDLAAQSYIADHGSPAPDVATLVRGDYLPKAPLDPFVGEAFIYKPDGDTYTLYGSGPLVSSWFDPSVEWQPQNGTLSPGVIRFR